MTNPSHISEASKKAQARKRRTIAVLSVVLVLLVGGAACGIGYLAWQQAELDRAAQEIEDTPVPETPTEPSDDASEDDRVENPVDFEALKLENPDIYAWIYVPETNINLPVLQHLSDDNYYLHRNKDGEYAEEGCIFSQSMNATDFSDPVTVLYGHNLVNETMFTQLHYFENEEFFADNDVFYLYMPGHILTYRIVSAYQYDDRHILNSFDFSDEGVFQEYLDYVANPDSLIANARDDVELNAATDKIVQLSTCMSDTAATNQRYIVSGVLVDDQQTF